MPKPPPNKKNFDVHRTLTSHSPGPNKNNLNARRAKLDEEAAPVTREKKRGFSFKRSVVSIVLIVFVFFLIIAIWDGIELSKASKKMFGSGNLFSLLLGSNLSQHDGRTNILLAGYSADDAGHDGANLTDSIMLISLDSKTKTGYMLSIPRDLYVNIPGFDYSKINAAYEDGQSSGFNESGYAPGGMGLLAKIVSEDFGVPIDYYALVDYAAFRDTVNAVGGIDVTINSPDGRLYDPNKDWSTGGPLVDLSNGQHHLNGQQALDLARARGDPSEYGIAVGFEQSDYQRATDQRMMLVALRQKSASWKTVLNPTKSGHLFDGMANNVKTDVSVDSALPLFSLINKVKINSIKSYSLRDLNGHNYLKGYNTYDGQSALIPSAGVDDYSDIQAAVAQLNQ